MEVKHVCVVTGGRFEYGYFKPILEMIIKSEKLELDLIVTGTHILEKYGNTIDLIKKDGFPVKKTVKMYNDKAIDEKNLGLAIGRAITNFTLVFDELKPDILLVLGDRYEPMAAVLAASTFSIPIAHIHGGDNVFKGQIDEQIRHAITKFAHIHFPATKKSHERIKLMGEEEWRIHLVGSPGIDVIKQTPLFSRDEICKNLNLEPNQTIVVCVQHSYVLEKDDAGKQISLTLKILKELSLQTVVIYPNNDPGSNLIIREIEKYRDDKQFKIFRNLDRIHYLSLLKNADLLVGNSSSGLIESPIFKIPVVNVGNRNNGRETAKNVLHAPHNYNLLKKVIQKALSKNFRIMCESVKNPYGDGKASERIVKILENLDINRELLIKKLTYNI